MAYLQVGGESIHYQEAGQGKPVVLIHGFFAWSFTWRKNLSALAEHFHVYAIDLRGFGFSQRGVSLRYGFDDQARMVSAFLDALGIERAALVGHSMGGEVALRFALLYPHRVEGLVLIAPSALVRRRPGWLEQYILPLPLIGPLAVRWAVLNRRFAVRAIRGAYHHPDLATAADLEGYLSPARLRGTARSLATMMRQLDFGRMAERLREVLHRSLIIWGEEDPWVPVEHGHRLAALLPNSKLVTFPGCGHVPPEECPDRFHQTVIPFLEALS